MFDVAFCQLVFVHEYMIRYDMVWTDSGIVWHIDNEWPMVKRMKAHETLTAMDLARAVYVLNSECRALANSSTAAFAAYRTHHTPDVKDFFLRDEKNINNPRS